MGELSMINVKIDSQSPYILIQEDRNVFHQPLFFNEASLCYFNSDVSELSCTVEALGVIPGTFNGCIQNDKLVGLFPPVTS